MGIGRKYFEPKSNMKPRWQAMWGDFAEDVHVISRSPDAVSDYGFTFAGWTPSKSCPTATEWSMHPNGKQVVYRVTARVRFGPPVEVTVLAPLCRDATEKERHKAKARSMILAKLRKAGVE